jgi:hypothetical protein
MYHLFMKEFSGIVKQSSAAAVPAPRIDTAGVCQMSGSVRSRAELCVAVRAWAVPARHNLESRGDWI